ncbi:VOC family protein [Motilimonas sp. E26]|uniref:VOC family protein n=1 Tax=Motilimonas sp. E26 TaxID=2865674 RepID=UPI001E3C3D70|nr:VOC family protein [Motilimonas sp. E26]MCE0555896.1 hypothetical protein [Motilimonas sp. E26]
MKVKRLLTNICTENLSASKAFYTSLFDFSIDYDSDWFVHLISQGGELEVGLISQESDVVPKSVGCKPSGIYLTIVVESVTVVYEKACQLNVRVEQPPKSTPYGQKRMLILSPEGVTIDVSSPDSA